MECYVETPLAHNSKPHYLNRHCLMVLCNYCHVNKWPFVIHIEMILQNLFEAHDIEDTEMFSFKSTYKCICIIRY